MAITIDQRLGVQWRARPITNSLNGEIAVLRIELAQEDDGRWMAEVPELSGVMAYGDTREIAKAKVEAPALRTLADRIDHEEPLNELDGLFVAT